jgi:hypothetical protein
VQVSFFLLPPSKIRRPSHRRLLPIFHFSFCLLPRTQNVPPPPKMSHPRQFSQPTIHNQLTTLKCPTMSHNVPHFILYPSQSKTPKGHPNPQSEIPTTLRVTANPLKSPPFARHL